MTSEQKRFPRRLLSLLLVICLLASLLAVLATSSLAAPDLPPANSQPRHVVCTELSTAAQAYYTGEYTYAALAALPGAADASDSWAAAQNNELYNALQKLMSETHSYYTSYSGYNAGALAYYWARTDAVSSGSTYVMFYSDVNPSGYTMNREHVWPKSRASFYQKNGGADLHHLRPSVSTLNSAKSNHRFGNIVGVYSGYSTGSVGGVECYWTYGSLDLFECKDDVKGDVARILLYVYCRWGQPNLYSDVYADKLPPMDADDSQYDGTRVVESLDTLLSWCENDPVDTWEMERNDLIQTVQGNRNVFIDYPEFAWLMFGKSIPAGMQTPSGTGCEHAWELTDSQAPTCTNAGWELWICTLCGEERTVDLATLGHIDENDDGYCDRCGAELATTGELSLQNALAVGDHAAIYHPASGSTLSTEVNEANRVVPVTAAPQGGVLIPDEDCAVFEVETGEGLAANQFYLRCRAGYLTTAERGNALSYLDAPNEYSIWYLADGESDDTVSICNLNASYYGKTQALEYYNGVFTTYSKGTGSAFEFALYTCGGHVWDEGVVTVQPTAAQAGEKTYTCVLCGKTRTEPVEPVAHTHDYVPAVTAPTCTEGGYTTYTCSICGDSYVADETEPLGHAAGQPVTENEANPTCTLAGGYDTVVYCTVCGAELNREHTEVQALGHTPGEPVTENETDPTCTLAGGYDTAVYCTACGAELSREHTEVQALGHKPGEPVKEDENAPTCTEAGGYDLVICCSVCGEELSRAHTDLDALGHDYVATVTEPTCTVGGYTTYICSRCGDYYHEAPTEPLGHTFVDGVCTVCGAADPDYEPPIQFEDIPADAYYAAPVAWAVAQGVTNGTGEGKFSPDADCTRAQVVTFLWRANGEPEPTLAENPFGDVAADAYYYKAVLWAVEQGITTGTSAATFSPDKPCTRAQVVTFLWRAEGQPAATEAGENETPVQAENPFDDVDASAYYFNAVLWAVSKGVTTGTGATTFSPDKTCTRGQIVTFLFRDLA